MMGRLSIIRTVSDCNKCLVGAIYDYYIDRYRVLKNFNIEYLNRSLAVGTYR
jgi:hypothetical protein